MKDFALKVFVLFTSASMFIPIIREVPVNSILEAVGLCALLFFPYRWVSRSGYRFWKTM